MSRLKIIGTGSYLPSEIIPNFSFRALDLYKYNSDGTRVAAFVGDNKITEEKIFEMSGIRERRKSKDYEMPSDLGYNAAIRAIKDSKTNPKDLVGIIFASVSEKSNIPSAAAKLKAKLGINEDKEFVAYDINNACAGFAEGLIEANARANTLKGNYLVVASECLTKILDYSDQNSYLFGDAAGAAVLTPCESEEGIVAEFSKVNSSGVCAIYLDQKGILRMPEGRSVLKNATECMGESAMTLKRKAGWEEADIYIFHQANKRIIDKVASGLKGIVFRNVEKYGNTSAATCAVALDEAIKEGMIKKGSKVIITGFGAGFVTSGVAIQF